MSNAFHFCDALGPARVIELYRPRAGLRAILVVDNTAAGPAIGGVRMVENGGVEECFRLARAMTLKNAAAGLPHGGGKSIILADPRLPVARKEALLRAFAGAIAEQIDYIPGPDMGTDERAMGWIRDEIGRAVGLPQELGGIPLDVIGATGWGIAAAAEVAQGYSGLQLAGARVAVQGFGAVGRHAARYLIERGAILVAAADSSGTLFDEQGLDVDALSGHKAAGGSFADYSGAQSRSAEAVLDSECDIWIPAARPDVLRAENVDRLRARLVIQGANIPATAEAEERLHARGVIVVPDFIANAGGVICAAIEYRGGGQTEAFAAIAEKVRSNTEAVLARSTAEGILPRAAAMALAQERVTNAMALRRRA